MLILNNNQRKVNYYNTKSKPNNTSTLLASRAYNSSKQVSFGIEPVSTTIIGTFYLINQACSWLYNHELNKQLHLSEEEITFVKNPESIKKLEELKNKSETVNPPVLFDFKNWNDKDFEYIPMIFWGKLKHTAGTQNLISLIPVFHDIPR